MRAINSAGEVRKSPGRNRRARVAPARGWLAFSFLFALRTVSFPASVCGVTAAERVSLGHCRARARGVFLGFRAPREPQPTRTLYRQAERSVWWRRRRPQSASQCGRCPPAICILFLGVVFPQPPSPLLRCLFWMIASFLRSRRRRGGCMSLLRARSSETHCSPSPSVLSAF